ncbi:MAG: hypothetical protein WD766_15295 [Gemmatimonadota bacterium]
MLEDERSYDDAWRIFRDAVVSAGAKAWRFRAAGEPRLFIEFLEFDESADPRRRADVGQAIERLDSLGKSTTDEWTDANVH